MSICRGCGQEIIWVKMESGKSNPCDPEKYNIQDNLVDKNLMVVSPLGKVGKLFNLEEGYISHFSTCPKSSNFRKKEGVK